jgi:hypothetical protein
MSGCTRTLVGVQSQQRSSKATRNAGVIRRSLQLGVFRLGLLEDRDVGVGVFPEGEEILVGFSGFRRVASQLGGARQSIAYGLNYTAAPGPLKLQFLA